MEWRAYCVGFRMCEGERDLARERIMFGLRMWAPLSACETEARSLALTLYDFKCEYYTVRPVGRHGRRVTHAARAER